MASSNGYVAPPCKLLEDPKPQWQQTYVVLGDHKAELAFVAFASALLPEWCPDSPHCDKHQIAAITLQHLTHQKQQLYIWRETRFFGNVQSPLLIVNSVWRHQ